MLVRFFFMADLGPSYQFACRIELMDYFLFAHGEVFLHKSKCNQG